MLRYLNRCGWWLLGLGLALVPVQRTWAFAFWGTPESFQTITLGYAKYSFTGVPTGGGYFLMNDDFTVHPRNLGEEFRWNNPVLYYTYDQSFLNYFGSNGVAAVDAAVGILNGLNGVSSYSSDLSEFPLEEIDVNATAGALHLFDLKSAALELLFERLGLADPEHWTWCLHAKALLPLQACPNYDFTVIQRNFDPVTLAPSRYVNGTLFTYSIQQVCPPDPRGDFGVALPLPVDISADRYTALATPKITLPDAAYYDFVPNLIFYGYFHTGLTRDDMGGLRYLYATNTLVNEASGPGTVTEALDLTTTNLLYTSNLTLFAALALTNDAPTLMGLYPGLVDLGTTPIFTNLSTTNLSIGYTNNPLAPYGTPPQPYYVTNVTKYVATWFQHSLANVVTNSYFTRAVVTVYSTNIAFNPLAPYGTPPQTNVSVVSMLTNMLMGDFYIMPSNDCGVSIIKTQLTSIIPLTNTFPPTNSLPLITNLFPAASGAIVFYFTNHVFLINPILCLTNTVALRQGIEKITFVRRDYDSLLGQYYAPITNFYTLTAVTNYGLVRQTIFRVVTQPDILFSAADLATGFPIPTVFRGGPTFDQVVTNTAAPGNIRGPVNFQFNKVGPIYVNGNWPTDRSEPLLAYFTWASFDGTTNAPFIYPTGASLANLENQALIQISPPYLPDGTVGVAYSAQLQTVGATPNWQAPFSWSLAPGSAAPPPGLTLSGSGAIVGIPLQVGFFNFVVQATDAAGRTAQQSYAINVEAHP